MTDNKNIKVLEEIELKKIAGGVEEDTNETGGGAIIFEGEPGYIKTGPGGNPEYPGFVPNEPGAPSYVKTT